MVMNNFIEINKFISFWELKERVKIIWGRTITFLNLWEAHQILELKKYQKSICKFIYLFFDNTIYYLVIPFLFIVEIPYY